MALCGPDFLAFYRELAPNNHRDWFKGQATRYENSVKKPFEAFVQAAIEKLQVLNPDLAGLQAKACIFRINRDVRFSADKTPYKLYSSAFIAPYGKKDLMAPGLYFEAGPAHFQIYTGLYRLERPQLHRLRQSIVNQLDAFTAMIENPEFKAFWGAWQGEKNKVLPLEFRLAAKVQPLLYHKQYYLYHEQAPEAFLSEQALEDLYRAYELSLPLSRFFEAALEEEAE